MKSSRTRDFRQQFAKLPLRIKETAKKNYKLGKQNPFHPSLEFKEYYGEFGWLSFWAKRRAKGGAKIKVLVKPENKYSPGICATGPTRGRSG